MSMMYMPKAMCAKCNAQAMVLRHHDAKTNQRKLTAMCHGETVDIEFTAEPNQTVRVFESDKVSARPT